MEDWDDFPPQHDGNDGGQKKDRKAAAGCLTVVGIGGFLVAGALVADSIWHFYPAQPDDTAQNLPETGSTPTPTPNIPASPSASVTASVKPSPSGSPTVSIRPSASPKPTALKPKAPLIVLDPGHSGGDIVEDVHTPGGTLYPHDYPSRPEMKEVFVASQCISQALQTDGFRVIITKQKVNSTVGLRKRAQIADAAHADLAVSIHDDHSSPSSFQAVYSQEGDGGQMYRGTGKNKLVFSAAEIAKKSDWAARQIRQARQKAQGVPVHLAVNNSYTPRNTAHKKGNKAASNAVAPGNLAFVQLLSHVPWVYNEMGARQGKNLHAPLSLKRLTAYTLGIYNGIEAAEPSQAVHPGSGAHAIPSCIGAGTR